MAFRTVVKILEVFSEVLGENFGKSPCYNTVENWIKKLGLSVYQDDQPCKGKKFAMVMDESIAINGQKLILALAIPSEHQDLPVKHEDVTVLNMTTIARFMNMSEWVIWGNSMLACYNKLPKEMQEAYAFINDYESLLQELMDALDAIRHIEHICKNKGFSCKTSKECQSYIVAHVIGNAYPRQAHLGLKMLEYFRKEEAQLTEDMNICISSDIIESTFGIYKSKKSPNKLYGITPFALMIPLYPKVVNESVTKTFNFKERLVNVKLKDIDAWTTEHLSKNWVTERTKTLKQVS